jgi:hypothetical protein
MPFRLKAFSLVLIVAALLALSGCAKPGVKELRESRDAVRAARNWENDATVRNGAQWQMVFLEKVECPSRRDMMWTIQPPKELLDDKGRIVRHDIWFDGTWYTSDGRTWETFRDAEKKLPGKLAISCGDGPTLASDGHLFSDLDDIVRKGEIRPGPKMTENGFDCTWWDVADGPGAAPRYTVCINTLSHLPQVVRTREHGNEYTYTLSQWNTASVGLPPELSR